jgi:NAD(P)-dependent dehydrogenase (short-subunit alcohol dehydrogenase family)
VRAFQQAGATVAAVSRSSEISADLTTPEGAHGAITQALGRYGRIDMLVHLMGGFAFGGPVADTDDHTWRGMLDVNLNAAFYTARAALPHLNTGGRLLFVGSRVGAEVVPGLSAYGVSKAGLIFLTRTIAAEVKDRGITANIVLPSVIDTPGNRAGNPKADYSQWVKPESIASHLVWLASDEAADVNGAVIPIYGRA